MKLILAIFRDPHYEKINQALISSGFRTTLVASTSGWLKKGVTTLLIGVEDSDVDKAIETIRKNCPVHDERRSHNATMFVLNTIGFERF